MKITSKTLFIGIILIIVSAYILAPILQSIFGYTTRGSELHLVTHILLIDMIFLLVFVLYYLHDSKKM